LEQLESHLCLLWFQNSETPLVLADYNRIIMNWTIFIITYWAQITILIAALGYLLKVLLDHRFRKKEIWHTIYIQKKMDYTLKYWEQYHKVESETLGIISVCKTGVDPRQYQDTDVLMLTNSYRDAGQTFGQLKLFISKKEWNILNKQQVQIGQSLQALIELLKKRTSTNLLTREFEELYNTTLRNIRSSDDEIFSLK